MRSFHSLRKLVLATVLIATPAAFAGVFVSVNIAPPALPVYTQPLCPGAGYIWTPGYWAYGPDGYYWVPGVWVMPPTVGYLWTPGYWGWGGRAYIFHPGYWGPRVGFYGGVNYGFGYTGVGYAGGYWNRGAFYYNRSVNNINVTSVHNVYNRTVVVNNYNRVSYNGGRGGLQARPTAQEEAAARDHHLAPTANQVSHREAASRNREQFASVNHGNPRITAERSVNSRALNQQNRVANGVRSGQMTPRETRNVETRESSINRQAARDRAANNGRLTQQQHNQIERRQNNVSRSIRNDNHNAQRQERPQQQEHFQGGHGERR